MDGDRGGSSVSGNRERGGDEMRVKVDGLHSGAAHSDNAGEHAQDCSRHLSGRQLGAGMFGDFGAADSFHESMSAAHAHHVATAEAHHKILNGVGDRARVVAKAFTTMDNNNAAELRELRCT
jgi:Protein of unknown function (DUF2563)